MLARTVIFSQFEIVQSQIYGSQLKTLNFLNEQSSIPPSKSTLNALFYRSAVTNFPGIYENRPFDAWFGFLKHSGLVVEAGGLVRISVRVESS